MCKSHESDLSKNVSHSSRLRRLADLLFIVGQCVPVYGDDVHVGVAVVLPDLLQLWIGFIDISIQLQKQESQSETLKTTPYSLVCTKTLCGGKKFKKKIIGLALKH